MKARIIYNLELNQLTTITLGCTKYKLTDKKGHDITMNYGLLLDMILPDDDLSE
jgi:hypothetical protein